MNNGRAKSLKQIAEQIFLSKKYSNDEQYKDLEFEKTVWMENTNRRKTEKQPDYQLVPVETEQGTTYESQQMFNEDGSPKMRDVQVCSGTITVHPLTVRGIYRNLKKIYKKDPKGFVSKLSVQNK
jgi:hypothetical protein